MYLFLTIWFTVFYLMLRRITNNQAHQIIKLIELLTCLSNLILDEIIEEIKGEKREKEIKANYQFSKPKQE